MTAAQPESPVTDGVRSLEVRWIFPGQLETAVAGWFGRFPAGLESREDAYLLFPHLRGLSVKLRAGGALDVKVYRGSPGILDVAGRARGRLESWEKWSFPFEPLNAWQLYPTDLEHRVGRESVIAHASESLLRFVTAAPASCAEPKAGGPVCSGIQEVPLAAEDPSQRC